MSRYRPEAPAAHRKTGILLANLGTPDAPTKGAVRRYLAEFLADPRVVELPRALWLPLLRGVILPLRSGRSAQKYAAIWTREGSPLAVHSERQARLLKGYLAESGPLEVLAGMSYGNPSIAAQLTKLSAAGCDRILVLPMFPQYSASASGAVFDAVARWVSTTRRLPELRLVCSFASHPGYIAALAESVRAHWARSGRASKLVISFHGLPLAQVDRGDPYLDECRLTAHRLTRAMAAFPEMVAGEGRACTILMREMGGRVAIKTGAEAVFVAIVPEKRLGIALKIEDGNSRASEAAIAALLHHVGVLSETAARRYTAAAQINCRGLHAAEMRLAPGFPVA